MKLTPAQVRDIYSYLEAHKQRDSAAIMARKYGVSKYIIWNIRSGRTGQAHTAKPIVKEAM